MIKKLELDKVEKNIKSRYRELPLFWIFSRYLCQPKLVLCTRALKSTVKDKHKTSSFSSFTFSLNRTGHWEFKNVQNFLNQKFLIYLLRELKSILEKADALALFEIEGEDIFDKSTAKRWIYNFNAVFLLYIYLERQVHVGIMYFDAEDTS